MRQPCYSYYIYRFTLVKRSFHTGEEIVPQRWNGKLLGENLKINT